jgi:hypothetical protein
MLVIAHAGHWLELPLYLAPAAVVVLWVKLTNRRQNTQSERDGAGRNRVPDKRR